jgi:hypothetical protein
VPALVAPLTGLVLGTLFAWLARAEVAAAPPGSASRGLLGSLWFGALVHAPAAGYLLAFYPDWSFSYWIPPQRTGTAPLLALALLNAGAPAAGFALASRWAREHRPIPLLPLAGVPTLMVAGLVIGQARRLRTLGTYAEFHGDFGTEPVAGSALGYGLLWIGLILGAGALWTARSLRLQSDPRRP